MVKPALPLLLSLALSAGAQGLSPTASAPAPAAAPASPTAQGLSPTARSLSPAADVLADMAPRPKPPEHPASARWEDFTAVTLLSAPFTAIWAVLGAAVVAKISQSRENNPNFFPTMGTPELSGAAMVAAAASVSIGLISVQWGGSPRAVSGTPAQDISPVPIQVVH
jgi:hypothetical protein